MLEEGLAMTISKPPTRQRMATWVTESLDDLGGHIVKAAWRRNGYITFLDISVFAELLNNLSIAPLLLILSSNVLKNCLPISLGIHLPPMNLSPQRLVLV